MTEKEANSDALRQGQEVKDGPFVFRISPVDSFLPWFKEECKDDELVLIIRNDSEYADFDPVVLRTLPFCVGELPAVSGIWFQKRGISEVVASALDELKGVRAVRFGGPSDLRIVPGFLSSLSHDLNRLGVWSMPMPGTRLSDSAGVLPSLTNLKELHLAACGLKELPAYFSHVTQLTELDLGLNKELERLPEDMCSKMEKLEVLDLSHCGLKELPANFGDLTQLTTLDLAGNGELEGLPEDMCSKMEKLEVLDLSQCGLKELPANFGDLTQLSRLNLELNKEFERLPEDMCSKMKNLEVLNVSYCRLRELPQNFGDLAKLRTFNCEENPLIKPPKAVYRQGVDEICAYFLLLKKKAETLKL